MECTCEVAILIRSRLDAIKEQTDKLRNAIRDNVYDPRSIIGDANLVIEAQLRQLDELVPSLEELRKRHQK